MPLLRADMKQTSSDTTPLESAEPGTPLTAVSDVPNPEITAIPLQVSTANDPETQLKPNFLMEEPQNGIDISDISPKAAEDIGFLKLMEE